MPNSFNDLDELAKVIGLGERSYRKTYYPELKRRMREVEESRDLLETIIDTAPVPIAYLDSRRRYVFVNESYAGRLKMRKKDVRGRPISEVLGAENYAAVAPRLEAAYAGEPQAFPLERLVPGTTERRSYIVFYAPHHDGGAIRGVVIAISDVTEIKEAAAELLAKEAEVIRSRDLLQAIIDNAPIPVAYLDEDERYVIANAAYLEMLGMREEEVIGREMAAVMSPENYAQVSTYCAEAAGGRTVRFPLSWGVPVTGERRFYIKRCAPDRDDSGIIHGIVSTLNDVTDLKEAEESLVAARDAAEAASRAKSEFLANMSHEMRTPLAGVLGMVNLVRQMKIGPEERSLLDMAQRSGESLLRLITDLLDFARIEAGKMPFERRPFSLRGCVESAAEVVNLEAERKGLRVGVDISPELPEEFEGDEGRLRQVLVNLIGNAVKFTESGEITAIAKPAPLCGDRFVQLSVRDTGIGIAPEKMDRLFQEFSQLDSSTTKRYGGTGLGLALSNQIVEKMGGRMWVESTPGKGSEFFFLWPVKSSEGTC